MVPASETAQRPAPPRRGSIGPKTLFGCPKNLQLIANLRHGATSRAWLRAGAALFKERANTRAGGRSRPITDLPLVFCGRDIRWVRAMAPTTREVRFELLRDGPPA